MDRVYKMSLFMKYSIFSVPPHTHPERERETQNNVRFERMVYFEREIRWIFWVGFRNFEKERERDF